MDNVIASKLNLTKNKLKESYLLFEKFSDYKLTSSDKMCLLHLLDKVDDKITYDFVSQKLYVYLLIIYSNFKIEYCNLEIDSNYMNTIIEVIKNTNIISELFKLL